MITDALDERRNRQFDSEPPAEKQGEKPVGGDVLEVDTATTVQTFSESNTLLTSRQHGWPRGAEVIAGRQLGQTPLMEVVKGVITSQITGGDLALPFEDDEPQPEAEQFRDTIRDILASDHVGGMELDDLIAAYVSDAVDIGWGYWEAIPSANGDIPLLQLKPVDALTIQHNLNENGQFKDDGPAYFHSPTAASVGGSIQPIELGGEPEGLDQGDLIAIRAPGSARSNTPYGQPPAVRAREWLEVYNNSTADINRDYDDTQIPEGVFTTESGNAADLKRQLQQSRGDKRKAPVVDYEVDWTAVGFDRTDVRIAEQEWFLKMVLAMFGINRNELGMTENTGLGTETPAQATLIYKKITLPFLNAITDALRAQALPQYDGYDGQFGVEIRNVDPRQEIVEQEEARKRFTQGTLTYAEMKQELGEDVPSETSISVGDATVDWATTPRWVVDQLIRVELNESGDATSGEPDATEGWRANQRSDAVIPSPDETFDDDVEPELPAFDRDPIVGRDGAARRWGLDPLDAKQLDEVIAVVSSFIASVAYNRTRTPFMQIEFEREGASNAVYWYSGVPEHLFFRFLQATSKGRFFNEYIRHTGRNNFDYVRVE